MEALVLFLSISSSFFSLVHGRTGIHHHHHQHTTNHSIALPPMADDSDESALPPTSSGNSTNSTSNAPPLPPPFVLPPAPSPKPANGITDVNPSSSVTVFNVRSFGAVGNGLADDTDAFKSAWDSACQSVSAVVLAPRDYSFMIRSTIFTGPCKDGVIFQVHYCADVIVQA